MERRKELAIDLANMNLDIDLIYSQGDMLPLLMLNEIGEIDDIYKNSIYILNHMISDFRQEYKEKTNELFNILVKGCK